MRRIFDAGPGENVPAGFNAVRVPLDATLRSDFKWESALKSAETYAAQGLQILWDLDLGLFNRLSSPLSDETQFRSLSIGLQHFLEHVWKRFSSCSLGVVLFRGKEDYHPSESLLHSRYMNSLADFLPDGVTPWLLLDVTAIKEPLTQALLLNKARWPRFTCAMRGGMFVSDSLIWDQGLGASGFLGRHLQEPSLPDCTLAVCLPLLERAGFDERLASALRSLKQPLKIIPEEFLTSEWDGLDDLIVLSDQVDSVGKRKLQGFCAAGGRVLTVGASLGLSLEVPFSEF